MSDHCNDMEDLQEVEVDQRALVNILSRYPGTFDVLRELIQNADDADAHIIDVHFQTEDAEKSEPASIRDVSTVKIRKWIIKNDGGGFQEHDWKRIGKIASGNDNSMKVGAFGVGFYSVLSKSDRPLVKSNGKSLQFDRGDDGKLRKRLADCPTDSGTSIELELRDAEPLPVLADLTRFLVSSVAFLTNIDSISVHLDGQRVLHIEKQVQPPAVIEIPQHLKPTTPLGTLTVESIQRTVQRIAVDAEKWAFTLSSTSSSTIVSDDDLVERHGRPAKDRPTRTSRNVDAIVEDNAITHDLYTATIRVNLDEDSEMKKGVESSMKSLPSSFKCKVVHFNSEQSLTGIENSHSPKAKQLACLFCGPQGIFPGRGRHVLRGRLFIGQSTNQTTGIGLHISAHFLPTMERGAIDLANGQVKAWNKEVLWIGGFLARIIYEEEMRIAAEAKDERAKQLGLCTMDRFAFGPTVPASAVSQILQEAFFSCCHKPKSPLPVVSDAGISCVLSNPFRQISKDISFLTTYRVLHEELEPDQRSQIINRYKIPGFKFNDIVQEFESGVTQDTMKAFFAWWEITKKNPHVSPSFKTAREKFCKEFPSRGVLQSSPKVKIAFKNINYFTFFPLPNGLSPPDTIYIDAASGVPTKGAIECFGWTQLSPLHWLEYACSQARQHASSEDPGQGSDVGYRILRAFVQFTSVENLPIQQWSRVAELMKDLECIPTNMGLKAPSHSYFQEAVVCGSLPVAKEDDFHNVLPTERGFQYKPVDPQYVRTVLSIIRVRRTIDWEDMVGRLETVASAESNYRLLLHSIVIYYGGQLTDRHIYDLQKRRVFYSEKHGRTSAAELLLPSEDVRNLGLPILALPQNGMTSLQGVADQCGFPMERFIMALGMREYPTLDKIIAQAASNKPEVRRPALQYLLSNLGTHYKAYKSDDFAEVAFIPTKCESLARPNEVFASPVWEKLGFKQISEDRSRDRSRLGVKEDPSIDTIIEYLKTPERTLPDLRTATIWFEQLYLHGKLPVPKLREQLSTIPFVPVENPGLTSSESSSIRYICPNDCFITSAETKKHYRKIFTFVDFGQNGNSFLESCCAKKSPNASDIVRKILEDPQGYLKALGKIKFYREDLRTIASQLDSISEKDKQAMKEAPMFLAERNGAVVEDLLPADQVLISDWVGRDFGSDVFVAPKDDILEKMYRKMGSTFLGTCVQHDVTIGSTAECSPPFNCDQVILRIESFMKQRDESVKTDVSFDGKDPTNTLQVGACESLTLEKRFAPPHGVLPETAAARTVETKSVETKAGFKLNEDGKSYTLWMVSGPSDPKDLHNDIAVTLCHALLKTYGPNDMLLLASLFAMSDKKVRGYYCSERKPGSSSARDTTAKPEDETKNKVEIPIPIPLPSFLVKRFGIANVRRRGGSGKQLISAEEDVERAIASCGEPTPNGGAIEPGVLVQLQPISTKKRNNYCKQAYAIRLREKKELKDEMTQIKFWLARDAKCQQPPRLALQEFAKLVSDLASVFDVKEPPTACYVFWKDTDDDLMAFNRDQKFILFNLAHYYKFYYNKGVEWRKTVIDWYLIMAHEIAHNRTMEHDEYHGSLSASIAVKYLPALHEHFHEVSWENEQLPQSTVA